jgi:hypothetical protein
MRKKLLFVIAVALLIAACGGEDEFPTGTFETHQGNLITIHEDGTHDLIIDGETMFTAEPLRIEGDEVTFMEVQLCPVEGQYNWKYDADAETLDFSLISDPCDARVIDLLKPLTRVDSGG